MEIVSKTYSNGLRSLSVISPDVQTVTIMFLVGVGSRYETQAEKGIAHFVEHTLFKGTQNRPSSKQIGMEIESLGGTSNAFTSYDYTGYYIKAPARNFKGTFEILADMFRNSLFKEEELEKEKGVIIEEIRMYEDRPPAKVVQEWNSNFFQGNSLADDITGTIESVSNMTQTQFFEFQKKHYFAENVIVVVAGNIDQNLVEAQINENCMTIPSIADQPKPTIDHFHFIDLATRKKDFKLERQVEQTHLILGGIGLTREDPRRFSLQVGNAILGSGFGSRLFQVIRDELGLAYYVYSRLASYEDSGVFQIGMGVDSKRVNEAMDAAKKQLSEIVEGHFTKEEFDRARNYLLGNLITDLETSDEIASFYGMQELLYKQKYTINEVKEKIMAVTLEDIYEVTKELFHEDNYFTTILTGKSS